MGRLHVTLISLLLVTLALAGCFGDDGTDDPDQTDGDDHDDDHDDGNQTDDGDQTDENATVDRSITFDGDIVEGDLPLVVNFTLNATDAENLTAWTLDFGDNGTAEEGDALPANATHTYEAEGNFTATFTVGYSDGDTLNDTLLVVVQEATAGNEDVKRDILIDLEGSMDLFVPAGLVPDGGGFCDVDDHARDNDLNGTYIEFFDLEVAEGSTRVYIEGGTSALDPEGLLPDFDVVIEDPDGGCTVGGSEGSYETASVKSGPAGTYSVFILYWFGPPAQEYHGFIEVNYGSFIE